MMEMMERFKKAEYLRKDSRKVVGMEIGRNDEDGDL